MNSYFSSIRFRLTMWYSGLLASFLIIFAAVTYGVVVNILREQSVVLDRETVELQVLDPTGGQITIQVPQHVLGDRLRSIGCPPGVLRPDPRCAPLRRIMHFDPAQTPATPAFSTTDVVHTGFDDETRHEILSSLLHFLLTVLPILIIVSLVGGSVLAKNALAPIGAITAAARRIRAGNLHERIRLDGPYDELRTLGDTFDDMIAELERLFEREKRFASDASHELQTPLAVIRTSAEVALADTDLERETRETLRGIVESTERISRIIDDLLLLASFEQSAAPREQVTLTPMLESTLRHLEPLADTKQIALRLVADPRVMVSTSRDRLERAVANLVENAIKYTDTGSVTVTTAVTAQQVQIAVADTGPGIPAAHLPHVFERFYRVDRGRSRAAGGTGLGLAIVHAAVDSLGGTIAVASTVGKGTVFTISLPLSLALG